MSSPSSNYNLLNGLWSNLGGMAASGYTGTHGWTTAKPTTGRILGGLVDQASGGRTGNVGAMIGEAVDATQGVASLAPKIGGPRAMAAAYGAYALGDLASAAGGLASGQESLSDYAAANRRQAGQRYDANVGENLAAPGRAAIRLGVEAPGAVSDYLRARSGADAVEKMERDRETASTLRAQQKRSDALKADAQRRGLVR